MALYGQPASGVIELTNRNTWPPWRRLLFHARAARTDPPTGANCRPRADQACCSGRGPFWTGVSGSIDADVGKRPPAGQQQHAGCHDAQPEGGRDIELLGQRGTAGGATSTPIREIIRCVLWTRPSMSAGVLAWRTDALIVLNTAPCRP